MPTTEFLPRPDILHADETSEQRSASFERYREWVELSPQTRMEIAARVQTRNTVVELSGWLESGDGNRESGRRQWQRQYWV